MKKKITRCWCGNSYLKNFSPTYQLCQDCGTLILKEWLDDDPTRVNDQGELYGKDYFLKYLPDRYNQPSLYERVRLDLTERIPYWLRTVIKYKLPPANILELGSAHGGFVAFLRWAGFDAQGLELSPWLTGFARQTFNIPILQGPLEDQNLKTSSYDVVAYMDVLEHFPNPLDTIKIAAEILKTDGIMLFQTPCFEPEKSYTLLQQTNDAFLLQLKDTQHLYLYSKRSVQKFFSTFGFNHVLFEPAIFSKYDMFGIASRVSISPTTQDEQVITLEKTPSGRIMLALLDLYNRAEALQLHADARLKIVKEQEAEIEVLRKAAQERLDLINKLNQKGKR